MFGRKLAESVQKKLAKLENNEINDKYSFTNILKTKQSLSSQLLSIEELAEKFHEWMQAEDRSAASHTDNLLKWYFDAVRTPSYKEYLAIAQAAAEKGYSTAIDIPLSNEEFNNYSRLMNFSEWMHNKNQTNNSDVDQLLFWYKLNEPQPSYEDFLLLAQLAANRGYATAIDVPLSAEEYATRFEDVTASIKRILDKHANSEKLDDKFSNLSHITFFGAVNPKNSDAKKDLFNLIDEYKHLREVNKQTDNLELDTSRAPKLRRV